MIKLGKLVCAHCKGEARKVRELRDEDGNVFLTDSTCADCGRSELRFDSVEVIKRPEPEPGPDPDWLDDFLCGAT